MGRAEHLPTLTHIGAATKASRILLSDPQGVYSGPWGLATPPPFPWGGGMVGQKMKRVHVLPDYPAHLVYTKA